MSADAAEVIAAVRHDTTHALIAFDFDGTLSPIVPDPAQSRPAAGAVDALRSLAEQGATVAIITGRDARTVLRLGGLDTVPNLIVEGLYGAERWQHGTLETLPEPPALKRLRTELPALVATHAVDPEVWIEDKRLSLVVHSRRAADPVAALAPLHAPVGALARELGLELHPGRAVLEVRLPGYDKGSALRRLVSEVHPAVVLFVGDDVGDLPAFAEISRLRREGLVAWSAAAASSEAPAVARAADLSIAGPAEVVALIRQLVSG